jgi:hypothetical protein
MKKIKVNKDILVKQDGSKEDNNLPGYPIYPASEDIYSRYKEGKEINPEEISKVKESNTNDEKHLKKDFNAHLSGGDLDIPGAELDDEQENIGSEDEENNYYSIGGDDHNDLDEDKDEL